MNEEALAHKQIVAPKKQQKTNNPQDSYGRTWLVISGNDQAYDYMHFLQNTYNPVPTDKGNTVSFVLCSTMLRGISCRPPVKVVKNLYALCKFQTQ